MCVGLKALGVNHSSMFFRYNGGHKFMINLIKMEYRPLSINLLSSSSSNLLIRSCGEQPLIQRKLNLNQGSLYLNSLIKRHYSSTVNGDSNHKNQDEEQEDNLPVLTDKHLSYDKQLELYSQQGNAQMYLLCAEKILLQLRFPHNKYDEFITLEFFVEIITLAYKLNNQQKVLNYYQKMIELNFIPPKDILYIIIDIYIKKDMLLEAINLLKSKIFRKGTYLPINEIESNQLFQPFFQYYYNQNNIQQIFEFYNLLLQQEEANATQLLTDQSYITIIDMMIQSNYLSNNKYEIIEHWIIHYIRQNSNSFNNKFHCEYFVHIKSAEILNRFLNHFILSNKSISLYENYLYAYEFCELFLSKRIHIHLPILNYLSWLIDNMPLRLQSFIKLLFKYETDDILLFEKICQKYSEKNLDEELAWVIQCMMTSSSSPKPSIPCALSLINLYLHQGNSFEAYQFIDHFTGAISQKKLYSEEQLLLCWIPLFKYYAEKGDFKLAKVALEQLRSIDFFPDYDCWKSTLQAAFKSGNVSDKEVMNLLHEMKYSDDLPPNQEIYHLILEYFLMKNFKFHIKAILQEMLHHNILSLQSPLFDKLQKIGEYDSLLVKFKENNSINTS